MYEILSIKFLIRPIDVIANIHRRVSKLIVEIFSIPLKIYDAKSTFKETIYDNYSCFIDHAT